MLESVRNQKELDLGTIGPAKGREYFEFQKLNDGRRIVYAGNSDQTKTHSLTFLLVEPEGQDACYLCTTEVSLGLFIACLNAHKAWPKFIELMQSCADSTRLEAPRVWRWRPRSPDRGIISSQSWLTTDPIWGDLPARPHYPETLLEPGTTAHLQSKFGGQPSTEHPIHALPAHVLVFMARLMDCRIPTAGEWAAAGNAGEGQPPADTRNLRDQTWAAQLAHAVEVSQAKPVGRFDKWPDNRIFWPNDQPGPSGPKAIVPDDGHNDHRLWFDTVSAGQPAGAEHFVHLIGNVAELVCNKPEEIEAIDAAQHTQIGEGLRKIAGDIGVIGGSALSDRQPAQRVMQMQPLRPGAIETTSYSDVGLRLAFTATGITSRPLARRIGDLLDKQNWYLTAVQ
jgi:hypothetical protein